MCHPEALAEGSHKIESNEILRPQGAQNDEILRHPELVSGSINADVSNQESGSKNEGLLNDKGLASLPLSLFASNISPLLTSPEGRKVAFTLAEVLITLGIIGVVAAMTLPTLIQNYKERATVTQLKKTYSVLSQAFNLVREEEGGTDLWADTFNDSTEEFMKRFGKHLKFIKTCTEPTDTSCFDYNVMYKRLDGGNYARFRANDDEITRTSAILSDGTVMMFNIRKTSERDTDGMWAQIYIDTNGSKAPNRLGEDFFYFFLEKNKIYPANDYNNCLSIGVKCAGLVIYNGNMDYLHCPDKFINENATSCKD